MVERFNGRISDVQATSRHLKQCPGADVDMLLLTVQSTYPAEGTASSITMAAMKSSSLNDQGYLPSVGQSWGSEN